MSNNRRTKCTIECKPREYAKRSRGNLLQDGQVIPNSSIQSVCRVFKAKIDEREYSRLMSSREFKWTDDIEHALVESILRYVILSWDQTMLKHLKQVESVITKNGDSWAKQKCHRYHT